MKKLNYESTRVLFLPLSGNLLQVATRTLSMYKFKFCVVQKVFLDALTDSTPSNNPTEPRLCKFKHCYLRFQEFLQTFYWFPLKMCQKMLSGKGQIVERIEYALSKCSAIFSLLSGYSIKIPSIWFHFIQCSCRKHKNQI